MPGGVGIIISMAWVLDLLVCRVVMISHWEMLLRKQVLPDRQRVKSGAVGLKMVAADHGKQLILEQWDDLPGPVKTGILAMVKAATQ